MGRLGHFPAISLGSSFVGQSIQQKLYSLCNGLSFTLHVEKVMKTFKK